MITRRSKAFAAAWLGCLLVAETAAQPGAPSPSAGRTVEAVGAAAKRCQVRQDGDGWWLVAPDGKRFFSLGVSVVSQGTAPNAYNAGRPSYAAWRHHNEAADWTSATLGRLTSWGFTTIGGWSDFATLRQSSAHDLWLTPVAHLGSTVGAPWWDMWDEGLLRSMDRNAREFIGPLRDDPRVIGYYSDNEIGWWDGALWRLTFAQAPTSGQRQRLLGLLRDTYHDDWDALVADFEPENARSWQELDRGGRLWLRPGSDGILTIRRFLAMMAERYYQLMHDLIRKYDPDALFLGDRYQSFYYPEVAEAGGRYVDVVSTNLNASWNDGTFLRSYLDTLHELTGKPILVSEFYMAADENRSGNRNTRGGFPIVATQQERVAALSNTLRAVARRPYVVGAEWFQYFDQPPHGRYDGEDFNFGLVDVEDRPYDEVTAAFAAVNPARLKSAGPAAMPDASSGVPPAPADPLGEFEFMRALKSWDRVRGFVPAASPHPLGDLYLCWSPHALYVAVYVLDVVDHELYRDAKVPPVDRGEWRLRIGDAEPIAVRIGYGDPPAVSDAAVRVESLSGIAHNLRSITAVEIPAERLGTSRLRPGQRVDVGASYVTHGRVHRLEWNGTYALSE